MMKKVSMIVLCCILVSFFAGCGAQTITVDKADTSEDTVSTSADDIVSAPAENDIDGLAEKNAVLGFALMTDLIEENDRANILISPISLYEDIALLTYGAAGDTRTEIEENILFADADPAADAINGFNAKLPETVHIANSIWYNDNFAEVGKMNEDYVKKAEQLFDAEIEAIPFDDKAVREINKWVSSQTDGMIKDIVNSLGSDEIIHLINAISFESKWQESYPDEAITEDASFINSDGESETVTLLYSEDERYHAITDSKGDLAADMFVRPYKDEKTAFVGILPAEGISIEEVIGLLKQNQVFTDSVKQAYHYEGDLTVAIPEYQFEYTIPMKNLLMEKGMKKAFLKKEADFSPLFGELPVYVSSVVQKTYIEVNRKGTKAAGVTDITDMATAVDMDAPLPKHIILNRPFVYAIVDMESGLPYFIGVQNRIN